MIFFSTGCFQQQHAAQIASSLIAAGIDKIELSGGLFSDTLLADLLALRDKCCFQLHNYFPPLRDSFVLNLGSLDAEVARKSMDYVANSMRWSIDLGRPVYSFHAGFMFDPKPDNLGKTIAKQLVYDRSDSLKLFVDRVNRLGDDASRIGVELLIENNVISQNNFNSFGLNPFLMAEIDEILYVMENTGDNINLLLDVGHLKVSGKTLGFDLQQALVRCEKWIKAYHLSENEGEADTHDLLQSDSWFWPHLIKGLDYYSLEINTFNMQIISNQLDLVKNKLK